MDAVNPQLGGNALGVEPRERVGGGFAPALCLRTTAPGMAPTRSLRRIQEAGTIWARCIRRLATRYRSDGPVNELRLRNHRAGTTNGSLWCRLRLRVTELVNCEIGNLPRVRTGVGADEVEVPAHCGSGVMAAQCLIVVSMEKKGGVNRKARKARRCQRFRTSRALPGSRRRLLPLRPVAAAPSRLLRTSRPPPPAADGLGDPPSRSAESSCGR